MKRILLALALSVLPTSLWAQCNGIFANNTVCGNATGSSNLPRPTSPAAFQGSAGGSNTQIQYNNGGVLGGLTDAAVTARIAIFASGTSGAVPSSGGGTTNFLRADATFAPAVQGTGSPVADDLAKFTAASANGITTAGYGARQIPGFTPTTATVTISNGANATVTWNSHGLSLGDPIFFCTTGSLPTGLTACVRYASAPECNPCSANTFKSNPTLYYVIPVDANTFRLATSLANARAGTTVTTSSAGSGTHTAFANAMAPTGTIGELIYDTVPFNAPVAATTGTPGTWLTLSLSAGIWNVGGNAAVIGTGGTTNFTTWHFNLNYGLGTSLSTSPLNAITAAHIATNDPSAIVLPYTTDRIFVTGATTLNANGQAAWTGGGTAGFYGRIWAERIK